MFEPLLALFLIVLIGAALRLVLREEAGPSAWWLTGWVGAGVAGILTLHAADLTGLRLLAHPLASLFPWLLLGGALRFADRPAPPVLLAAGLTVGLLRVGLTLAGHGTAAYVAALGVEPAVSIAAAVVATRAARSRPNATTVERLVGPAMGVLALLGAFHLGWLTRYGTLAPWLVGVWTVATPGLLGIQMQGAAGHARRGLRRARDELELRVAGRTAELAQANRALEERIARHEAAERALRRSEERYRVISELSSDLCFAYRVEPDGRVVGEWVTDALREITGYARKELQGAHWLRLIHPEDMDPARLQFLAVLSGALREMQLRIVRKDGEVRWIRAAIRITRDMESGCLRAVGAASDVTDTRRAEEERTRLEARMRDAERLESLGLLAGGIAHDFNNLLTVILGNARLAVADLPAGAAARMRLGRIEGAARHASRLTEQMLAYGGRAPIQLKPTDLSMVVEDVADVLRASLPGGARLETELPPQLLIDGDATQLSQVVMNLVANAGEALPNGTGVVRVCTGMTQVSAGELAHAVGAPDPEPGSYVFLEVSDTGAGMDDDTRRRVFEPFFSTKFSGRGLGLAAVLGLVAAHRALLLVKSAPSQGACFRVLFPPAQGLAAPDPRPATPGPAAR